MMKREFWILFLAGWVWHMLYDITGYNYVIGLIAPVNESVWEHLKLGYGATLVLMVDDAWRALRRQQQTSVIGRVLGIIVMNVVIVAGFYSYKAIIGTSIVFIDIALYGVACWVASITHERINMRRPNAALEYVGIAVLSGIAFMFAWLTLHVPPQAIFHPHQ